MNDSSKETLHPPVAMTKANTFCLAPWVHATVHSDATLRPCCANQTKSPLKVEDYQTWWNGEEMQQLRRDLSNGVKVKSCDFCWRTEDLGKESTRINYNHLFKKYVDFKSIKQAITNNDFVVSDLPKTWDFRPGNQCNLKCIMCSAPFSNKIQQEVEQNQSSFEKFPKLAMKHPDVVADWTGSPTAQKFLDDVTTTMRWVKLQGGEPLSIKNIRRLIDNIDGSKCTLAITTNGTICDQALLDKLAKFDRVEMSISLEADSPANDIIRYGSDWQIIKRNIERFKKLPNIELQINHCVQITSVFYLADVIKYCESINAHLLLIRIDRPSFLNVDACPTADLQRMSTEIEKLEIKHPKNQYIKSFIKTTVANAKFDENLWKQFNEYVETLDQIRSKKLSSVINFTNQQL
jgi:MoaA/NifB/PqqE/SkfB family radical SAM enzyme